MIESLLLNNAFVSGRLAFEEAETHYRLVVRWGGMRFSVATLSKETVKEMSKPKLEVVK